MLHEEVVEHRMEVLTDLLDGGGGGGGGEDRGEGERVGKERGGGGEDRG